MTHQRVPVWRKQQLQVHSARRAGGDDYLSSRRQGDIELGVFPTQDASSVVVVPRLAGAATCIIASQQRRSPGLFPFRGHWGIRCERGR
jgi:hypothetical protein